MRFHQNLVNLITTFLSLALVFALLSVSEQLNEPASISEQVLPGMVGWKEMKSPGLTPFFKSSDLIRLTLRSTNLVL
jgi:hypothetical protein